MRNFDELNITERGKPVRRPAPTAEAITAFERYFSLRLPTEYLELLRHSNGGHPEMNCVAPFGRESPTVAYGS